MSHTLSEIIECFGDPNVLQNELDWMRDIPAGKQLLDWLVSQAEEDSACADASHIRVPDKQALRACFGSIALETEELDMAPRHLHPLGSSQSAHCLLPPSPVCSPQS
ncbi:hypothetical protein NEOLEDRAFT_1137937 [Neolentinus lepideus HHB14362 ss-1]|uniref:Uncharacterized protein n=1 Tax=Neolentinus lepideus HHB14362 ss-1 TaxID=1314782 RepID=A0A165QIM4_9AGAM|nr:hypothetical protein NEOLEDRAFT_1137937 [Neolentinus lepideus HHB14362 ss-1]